jgi:hypothetical protein
MDPDPSISSLTFKMPTKNLLKKSFSACYFFKVPVLLHHFSKVKSQKEITNQYKSRYFLLFCLMIEGSGSEAGSGSIHLTNGSGSRSRRPKKTRGSGFGSGSATLEKRKYGTYQDTCLSCCALWTRTVFCPDTHRSVLLPPHCRAGPRSAQSQRVAPPCTARTSPVLSSSDSCLSVKETQGILVCAS